jgi:hypothetical protein
MSCQSHQEFSSEGFNFSGTQEKLRHICPIRPLKSSLRRYVEQKDPNCLT